MPGMPVSSSSARVRIGRAVDGARLVFFMSPTLRGGLLTASCQECFRGLTFFFSARRADFLQRAGCRIHGPPPGPASRAAEARDLKRIGKEGDAMRSFLAVVSLWAAGCAPVLAQTEVPCPEDLAPERAAPVAAWVPKPTAAAFDRPADCVGAARHLHDTDREAAWALIRACVARGHFTALRELLYGAWDDDSRLRPDAPALLTQIIAMRGGLVDGDVRLLHERRVPLFTLAEATARPDYFRGRFVVVRARVAPDRSSPGVVRLAEQSLHSDAWDIDVTPTTQRQVRSYGRSPSLPNMNGTAEAGPGGDWNSASATRRHVTIKRPYNYESETGREAVAHLLVDDPFFDPDGSFVVLARFDGAHDSGGSDRSEADLTVLDYQRPAALVMY